MAGELEGKLVESFNCKEIAGLSYDYAELGLDNILDDGVAKEIPVLKTVLAIAKVGINIKDRIYLKKLIIFLREMSFDTTQEQRDNFVKKHCKNVKQFEEAINLIIDKSDVFEKSSLIGKIFKCCLQGLVSYSDCLRLSDMVNRSFWIDLESSINESDNDEHKRNLYIYGFYDMEDPVIWTDVKMHYKKFRNKENHKNFRLNNYGSTILSISKGTLAEELSYKSRLKEESKVSFLEELYNKEGERSGD